MPVILGLERERQADTRSSLASKPTLLCDFQASERLFQKHKVDSFREATSEIDQWSLHIHKRHRERQSEESRL